MSARITVPLVGNHARILGALRWDGQYHAAPWIAKRANCCDPVYSGTYLPSGALGSLVSRGLIEMRRVVYYRPEYRITPKGRLALQERDWSDFTKAWENQ